MTKQMFEAMLRRAECTMSSDGRAALPDGRTMTLYLSRSGASLQVARVVELQVNDALVEALDNRGELFIVAIDDLFAASVSAATTKAGRKAGFLG
jgi:hypothetical protein